MWASLGNCESEVWRSEFDIDEVCEELVERQRKVLSGVKSKDKILRTLCVAADQFVVKPLGDDGGAGRTSILAGFPWFMDWGRDACIALPGLLLGTGRFADARDVLLSFARAADGGMIPNRFDDRAEVAHFNSIDASLWFVNAAFEYFERSGDEDTFGDELLPVIRAIIEAYHKGARFGIRADEDGLITGGDAETQLTWMDARCNGVTFTPRYGKAVEINALWYCGLCRLAEFYAERDVSKARIYHEMADVAEESFNEKFWNEEKGYLNDCIRPDGTVDESMRPNQIFAVSLAFSPLSARKQRLVVRAVKKHLLTEYGLRTLSNVDERYRGRYEGDGMQRDGAYHQGTVWPYLMGAYVEAFLKVHNFSRESRLVGARCLRPLLEHVEKGGCLGSVSEIFDGDGPQKAKGCFAQAWSVGELIRAYKLCDV